MGRARSSRAAAPQAWEGQELAESGPVGQARSSRALAPQAEAVEPSDAELAVERPWVAGVVPAQSRASSEAEEPAS